MREEPVVVAQESHITESMPTPAAAAAGRHIKDPVGAPVPSTALWFFILSSQKWVVWIQAGACWLEARVWVLSGYTCAFPACREEVLFYLGSLNWFKEPKRKLYFPAPTLLRDFDGKCPHVASWQICRDLECRYTSSRKSIASDIVVGSFGRFPRCVCLQL